MTEDEHEQYGTVYVNGTAKTGTDIGLDFISFDSGRDCGRDNYRCSSAYISGDFCSIAFEGKPQTFGATRRR